MLFSHQTRLSFASLGFVVALAESIVQAGGMTCLDDEGMAEISKLMDYYLENAKILKEVCAVCSCGVFRDVSGAKAL